jgi:RimJ/RimL family protein N-acetyltransferase
LIGGEVTETILETERLLLRTWDDADVDPYMNHLNTPAVLRWLGPPISRDAFVSVIAQTNAAQAELGHCFWAVERRADRALIGFCGLKRVDASGTDLTGEYEIGWRLREDAWGKGFAREAATASLRRAFEVHDAPRVVAFTLAGNRASWGLMERLGMNRREDLDFDDPDYGPDLNPTIVYVLEKDQWTA